MYEILSYGQKQALEQQKRNHNSVILSLQHVNEKKQAHLGDITLTVVVACKYTVCHGC